MGDSVFVNGRAVVHKGSSGSSTASPDVCLCPPGPPAGPVPVPLVNLAMAADMDGGAPTVLVEGNPQGHKQSFFRKTSGDEVAAATGGGILTGVVQGQARFRFGYSRNVLVEGEPAVRHLDPLTHNHAGFAGNTPPAPWISIMDPDAPRAAPKRVVLDGAEGPRAREQIEIRLLDEIGHLVEATAYRLQMPGGRIAEGRTLRSAELKVVNLNSGTCELVLPEADRKCRAVGRSDGPRTGGKQVPYLPGTRLKLPVGKTHEVVVPGLLSLWVDLPLDTLDVRTRDDRFILRSSDGKYEVVQAIKDDRVRGDRQLTLEFPGLRPGLDYSLVHDPGVDGVPVELFTDRPFDELYEPPPLDESLAGDIDSEP